MKLCPVNMKKGEPCDDTCPFRGPFTDQKTGETFLSCHVLHKRLAPSETPCATDAGGNKRSA